MSDAPEDRRRAERVSVNDEFARLPVATWISDLSEYGVFVQTSRPARLGARVALRFTVLLDDPIAIEAEGNVVRLQDDPCGMGIEFVDLSPETILRINDVVSLQRAREAEAAGDEISFDSDKTRTHVPIPIAGGHFDVRSGEDVDERTTDRYPVVGGRRVAQDVVESAEYELDDDDLEEDGR